MSKLAEWLGMGGLANSANSTNTAAPEPVPYTPASLEELVDVIRRAPSSVLTAAQKKSIARAMSFPERKVAEVMLPREKLVFVEDSEFLGPLTLDRLYKSGFSQFPVVDKAGKIIGLLKTEKLNNLKIREGMPAKKYADKDVVYVGEDEFLIDAVVAMLRADSNYVMVVDAEEKMVGALTMEMAWMAILG